MTVKEREQAPYLTVDEVATALNCGRRNVYKLIEDGKLPAVRLTERKTTIPRAALDAYQRRINGQGSLVTAPERIDPVVLEAEFAKDAGVTPGAFYAAFKAGKIEDSSANMQLLVRAIALGAGSRGDEPAPVKTQEWAIAAARLRHARKKTRR